MDSINIDHYDVLWCSNKRRISIFGGSQLRPNIHIDDMVRVYEKIITAPSSKVLGEIFNAGYHNHSVKELGQIVKKEHIRIVYILIMYTQYSDKIVRKLLDIVILIYKNS